jgi:hypothetical protein
MSKTFKPHPRDTVRPSIRQMSPIGLGAAVFGSTLMRAEACPAFAVIAGSRMREVTT